MSGLIWDSAGVVNTTDGGPGGGARWGGVHLPLSLLSSTRMISLSRCDGVWLTTLCTDRRMTESASLTKMKTTEIWGNSSGYDSCLHLGIEVNNTVVNFVVVVVLDATVARLSRCFGLFWPGYRERRSDCWLGFSFQGFPSSHIPFFMRRWHWWSDIKHWVYCYTLHCPCVCLGLRHRDTSAHEWKKECQSRQSWLSLSSISLSLLSLI